MSGAIMVAAHDWDILGARAAGMPGAFITRRGHMGDSPTRPPTWWRPTSRSWPICSLTPGPGKETVVEAVRLSLPSEGSRDADWWTEVAVEPRQPVWAPSGRARGLRAAFQLAILGWYPWIQS